ncbi:cytochrome P460 family protein [Longitalea arenae]|uniref:cytochrome P460 family protein n=1 Tax=Longitalea arenae TaxID=2812558 RepID=UPI0019674402|nr:cytochrome P460 family protein [Longitalea arenae]
MKKIIIIVTLTASCLAYTILPKQPVNEVPYPEGYRKWTHIKTSIVGPQHPTFKVNGGFHHIYANEKAMQGYLTGHFPEGAVIVADALEAHIQQNSNMEEGKRRHIDVMIKDSIKYAATGGWGYEEFNGDSKTERNANSTVQRQCFNCHSARKNYVFSNYRN